MDITDFIVLISGIAGLVLVFHITRDLFKNDKNDDVWSSREQ